MPGQRMDFLGADGHSQLAGRLDLPTDGAPRGYALFAHCFTCSKDIFAAARIAHQLAALGLGVLRFDFTGLGHSEGEFANTNFSSNVGDLVAAARHLEQTKGEGPALLIGHSLGGAAVLAAAAQLPAVKAVVTIGAPAEPGHVANLFEAEIPTIESEGEAAVRIGGRRFHIQRQFLEDLEKRPILGLVKELRRPLLIFHAPGDLTVGIENASQLFVAARHPKSFVSLDDADHLLTRKEDARFVASVIGGWVSRYLPHLAPHQLPPNQSPPPLAEAQAPSPSAPAADTASTPAKVNAADAALLADGWSLVDENPALPPLGTRIHTEGHQLLSDEPVHLGGHDSGPSPYGFLQAALGGCTALTLRMYARRHQWPLERVRVWVRHGKIHAEHCATCETQSGRIDRFERRVILEGPLDATQRARLLQIADRCPVHRTLLSEVDIVTTAEDDA